MAKQPDGVVMCLVAPDGHVVATADDFHRDGYGGYSLQEAQEHRCVDALEVEIINAFCSPIIAKVLSGYERDAIRRRLCGEHGYRVEKIVIGHEPATEQDRGED